MQGIQGAKVTIDGVEYPVTDLRMEVNGGPRDIRVEAVLRRDGEVEDLRRQLADANKYIHILQRDNEVLVRQRSNADAVCTRALDQRDAAEKRANEQAVTMCALRERILKLEDLAADRDLKLQRVREAAK